jgi:cation:H+ antiporter
MWQSYLQVISGLVILIYGAELLVRGASRLALIWGMPPLLIGLTVVALGTSAPELAISTLSAFRGQGDLALGNVVGSNIFNTLLILGLSAAITPIVVQQKLLKIDVPIMIAAAGLVWLMVMDGNLSWWEGGILTALLIGYVGFSLWMARREPKQVVDEYQQEFGKPLAGRQQKPLWNAGLISIGLVMLVAGSRLLVTGAVAIAHAWGVSELIIGLTILAGGTSTPEIAASIVAALKGEQDIAVGNVVGSNIFNLLGVLGLASLVTGTGITASAAIVTFDLPFMIGTAIACLPIFFTGNRISRWEGGLFLAYYIAYMTYIILQATRHETLPVFSYALITFVLPLTGLTIGLVAFREWRARRHSTS